MLGHDKPSLRMPVRILQSNGGSTINWNKDNPPIIFFDTNVWRSMKDADVATLKRLQENYGFCYRYSATNFIELASHLEDQPSRFSRNPFQMFQSCFRRIRNLCDRDILPSPEMVFLESARLSHYIDDIWIPNVQQMALAVELIANANSLAELMGEEGESAETINAPRYVVKPNHYRSLRNIDGNSMRAIMDELREFNRPIFVDNRMVVWFQNLAHFFLFFLPTNGRKLLENTTREEYDRE